MRQWIGIGALAAQAVWLAGCAAQPVRMRGPEPLLAMSDVAPGLPAGENEYVLLADARSQGRFATALALAKLAPGEDGQRAALTLVAPRAAEQGLWNEQLRGVDAIRELVFLTPVSVRGVLEVPPAASPEGPAGLAVCPPEKLCAAARRIGAGLLLVYVPNVLGPNAAQVLGVLYDPVEGRALATLHTSAEILDAQGGQTPPDALEGDHREDDAFYQAQRGFEAQVLACLGELIQRDTPPTTTQPHNWHKPLMERWWLPER